MKKLLPIIFILILSSCSKEVPLEQTVVRGEIVYLVNSEEPFTGTTVSYYENGQLETKGNYKDGNEEGLREGYFDNGQLEYKTNYKDGKLVGLVENYYENGQLQLKGNYKDEKEDGLWETYRVDGLSMGNICVKNNRSVHTSNCEKKSDE